MNENLNLVEILKDCPRGTYLWCDIWGKVQLLGLVAPDNSDKITIRDDRCFQHELYCYGNIDRDYPQCCVLWPSKDCRNWSEWKCPKAKKPKFDPKTLKPFDKVLARINGSGDYCWFADFVAEPATKRYPIVCLIGSEYTSMVIPYNDDTKHLVGTIEEAPEYYRYWED